MRRNSIRFITLVAIFATVLFSACATPPAKDTMPGDTSSVVTQYDRLMKWLESPPCGVVEVRDPLVNVSGTVTGTRKVGRVWIYIAPNLTSEGARYATEHCGHLGSVGTNESGSFLLLNLPPGDYFAVFGPPGEPATVRLVEKRGTEYAIASYWSGRVHNVSVTAFRIQESAQEEKAQSRPASVVQSRHNRNIP